MIKLTKMNLDLAKNEYYNLTELKLRQFDYGYILVFALTDSWLGVDVSADNLGFRAIKPDKTVIDVKKTGFTKDTEGYWNFVLPKELTQLASPAQKGHIYVQDGENVYTSSDITFYIEPQFGENSGVSSENIEEIKRLLENAHALNTELQRIQNSLQNEKDTLISNSQTDAKSAIDKIKNDGESAINKVSADGSNAVNEVTSSGNTAIKEVKSAGASAVSKVSQDGENAISRVSQDGKNAVNKVAQDGENAVNKVLQDGGTVINSLTEAGNSSVKKIKNDGEAALNQFSENSTNAISDIKQNANAVTSKIESEGASTLSNLKTEGNAAIDQIKADGTSTVNDLKTAGSTAVDKVKTDGEAAVTEINKTANSTINSISEEGEKAVTKVSEDGKNKIDEIDSKAKSQRTELQNDYNSFKESLSNDFSSLKSNWDSQLDALEQQMAALQGTAGAISSDLNASNGTLDSLQKEIRDSQTKIDNIKNDLANVDFNGIAETARAAKKSADDAQTLANTANIIANNAGKVKTVSLNGGAKIDPDTAGNIDLPFYKNEKLYKLELEKTEIGFQIKQQNGFIKLFQDNLMKWHIEGEISFYFETTKSNHVWDSESNTTTNYLTANFVLQNINKEDDYLKLNETSNSEINLYTLFIPTEKGGISLATNTIKFGAKDEKLKISFEPDWVYPEETYYSSIKISY